jgi:hypothetical protein
VTAGETTAQETSGADDLMTGSAVEVCATEVWAATEVELETTS